MIISKMPDYMRPYELYVTVHTTFYSPFTTVTQIVSTVQNSKPMFNIIMWPRRGRVFSGQHLPNCMYASIHPIVWAVQMANDH